MESQIENAILVAFDPLSSYELKNQAFEFFNQLRANPQGWPTCLELALRAPKAREVVRHGCLEVVVNAISTEVVDSQGLQHIRETLMNYLQYAYTEVRPQSDWDAYSTENKFAQLLTDLFVRTYQSSWPTFFQDILSLCTSSKEGEAGHLRSVRLYLRVLSSIHDEIGDTLVSRSNQAQRQANDLKDLIRERDVSGISQSWMDILQGWHSTGRDNFHECLIVIGKWATWIDLTLIINEPFLKIIVTSIMSAAQDDAAEEATPAANAMLEIVAKKMKPEDKLHLLDIFRLQELVQQISTSSRLQDRSSSEYDTDLAELAARIVNAAILELVIVSDSKGISNAASVIAREKIKAFLPFLLRYFADDFDEVCSTVIPSLTELLSFVRKRADQNAEWTPILPTVLQAIIAKMKYDDTSDWGSEDSGTEEAEFQDLRKRLEILQQTIANINEPIYVQTIRNVVIGAFEEFQSRRGHMNWRVLDLALHEMFIFGLVAQKGGALYNKSKPITPAAESLVEMLIRMSECGIAEYDHPAIQLQYLELCVRYYAFFDNNPQYIQPALANFARFIHHNHIKVRHRSWYLFHRFTKLLKPHVGSIAGTIIQSIGDLLIIKAEVKVTVLDEDEDSDPDQNPDSKFSSQLYLYEAIGNISTAPGVSVGEQVMFIKAVTDTQFADLENQLDSAKSGNERPLLQVHHIISAMGTLAHGFVDSTPSNVKRSSPVAPEISLEFIKISEAILVALDSLNSLIQVRDAARTAFARLLGVLGTNILPQLPRWFSGLLVSTSSKDEIASFLRLLGQVIFALSTDVHSFLNGLFTPLLQRVFTGMSEPTNGTDDEIQLVELKTHYLAFLQVILNQGISSILVSNENQAVFDSIISSIEHFTKDAEDLLTAKIAFQVLNKMSETWGGPEVIPSSNSQPQPTLPGFDRFMIERFSGLVWALLSQASFDPKDARSRQVLIEAAGMQNQIFLRTGSIYLDWLKRNELKNLGMGEETIDSYLTNLASLDAKGFRQFFLKLAQSLKS